jgi:hypothetical protein
MARNGSVGRLLEREQVLAGKIPGMATEEKDCRYEAW